MNDPRETLSMPLADLAAPPRAPRKPYVRKRYWNEARMGWWERAYLFEVVRGLAITGGVFTRNMLKWMTGRKGALTTYYPEETRPDYARHNRGKHVLTQRPDGRPQCVACNMCATVCPAKVIEIEAAFDPADPAHPKYPSRFEIDYSRCVFCGLCVEACPEDAIRMAKEVPALPSHDRRSMWLGKEELLSWQPQRDVAKPYPVASSPRPSPQPSRRDAGRGSPKAGAETGHEAPRPGGATSSPERVPAND